MRMNKKENTIKLLIYAYFILKPFYLWDYSFQLADIVLVLVFLYLLGSKCTNHIVSNGAKGAYQYYMFFMTWTILVNAAWYCWAEINHIGANNEKFLTSSIYYIFNAAAITVIIWAYEILGDALLQVFVRGCFYSVIITTIFSAILWDTNRTRQLATFDNPNQLGYYAIIMLTVAVLWGRILTEKQIVILVLATMYLNIISLSKASILAGLILLLMCLFYNRRKEGIFSIRVKAIFVCSGFLLVCVFLLMTLLGKDGMLLNIALKRILNMASESDSDLVTGRGYGRVLELRQHFLWGMGEGAFERFSIMSGREIHATIISVYVSYGLVGILLLAATILKALFSNKDKIFMLMSFSGIFLYWFTHNGVRNTIVWMLFTLVALSTLQENINLKVCKNE